MSASLDLDAVREGRATLICLPGAEPVSSIAKASGPIIPPAQWAYSVPLSILGGWDPQIFTYHLAHAVQASPKNGDCWGVQPRGRHGAIYRRKNGAAERHNLQWSGKRWRSGGAPYRELLKVGKDVIQEEV